MGCEEVYGPYTVNYITGTQNFNLSHQIKILGNPVSEALQLQVPSSFIYDKIILTDYLGRTVQSFNFSPIHHYPMQAVSNGVYFIQFYNNESYLGATKIIKLNP